ncbi:MAG: 3'-5' exonuclease [Acidimicrobiia bacterium]|nr:3'-5' exonuclease [Acidimicrobiia bacterium]
MKGREWPHVVVYAAHEGLFPHRLAGDVEEERRVFHVAVTRAGERAVVMADERRPSRFLDELERAAPHPGRHAPIRPRPRTAARPPRACPPRSGSSSTTGATR